MATLGDQPCVLLSFGGTGIVGTYAVRALTQNGHEAVAISRSAGVGVVTDVTHSTDRRGGSATLLQHDHVSVAIAEERANVRHHVLLSSRHRSSRSKWALRLQAIPRTSGRAGIDLLYHPARRPVFRVSHP